MPFGSGGPGFTGGKGNIDGPLTITGVLSGSSPITSSGIQVVNHPGDGDTLTITHNGTDARVISSAGSLKLEAPSTIRLTAGGSTDAVVIQGGTNEPELQFLGAGTQIARVIVDRAQGQFTFGARSHVGRQFVFTDSDNAAKDHDHPVQTHPTLFIHSSKNPNADNNQWVSLHHNGTGSFIESPTGHVNITGAAGPHLVVQATDGDHVALWHDGTDAYLTSSTGDIILKPAGADVIVQNDSGPARLHVVPSADAAAQITFAEASTSAHMFSIEAVNSTEELLLATNARTGRAIIITNAGSIGEDHDHGVQTDPTLYIHSVTNPGDDNTEWGSLSFSSANDEFNIDSAGKMQISTTGPELFLGNAVNAADVRIQGGTSAQQTSLGFYEGSTRHMVLGHKASIAQNAILVDDGGGNQLVFGNGSFIARDFDHAVQTDPTLFVHSDIDPNTNNTQFVGLHHDQTDGRIVLGTGKLIVSGTHGDAYRGENAAAGMEVHGSTGLVVKAADGDHVALWHDGTAAYLTGSTGILKLHGATGQVDMLGSSDLRNLRFYGAAAQAEIGLSADGTNIGLLIKADSTADQVLLTTHAETDNQINLTTYANKNLNHEHPDKTDPALYIHSRTLLSSEKDEFVSLHHDQTDTRIELGTGKLIVSGTHGTAEIGENAAAGMEVHGTNGLVVNSATANAVGGGFDAAESLTMYVSKINGEIVTTILVNIKDLVATGDQGTVIGETGIAAAYLTQITTAVNGLIYKVEMSCIEVPAGTNCTLDIDLFINDTSIIGNASVGPGGSAPLQLIAPGANWASGVLRSTAAATPLSATVDDFLYLVTGDAATSGGTYTAGKFIIKLYGASF